MTRRRLNPRAVSQYRSYSVTELAACFGVHKNTVRHWQLAGLMPNDDGRPYLFQGGVVRAFLLKRNASRKRPCQPGTFYCFRCRDARPPALGIFPATEMGQDANREFQAVGIVRSGWSTTQPINAVFRRAFVTAGLPYYNPHSLRDMLVRHAMSLNLSVEELKAWSQNLGHSDVTTTLTSYGTIPDHRQGELIRATRAGSAGGGAAGRMSEADIVALARAVIERVPSACP